MVLRVHAPMPTDRVPRGRGWAFAVIGLLALAVYTAITTVIGGAEPSGYRGHHMAREAWVYPADEIRVWLGVMATEVTIACLALAARTRFSIGARALLLGGLFFCILVLLAPLAMHAGTPIIEHLLWLFFASVFLVVFAIVSAIAAAVLERRGHAPEANMAANGRPSNADRA